MSHRELHPKTTHPTTPTPVIPEGSPCAYSGLQAEDLNSLSTSRDRKTPLTADNPRPELPKRYEIRAGARPNPALIRISKELPPTWLFEQEEDNLLAIQVRNTTDRLDPKGTIKHVSIDDTYTIVSADWYCADPTCTVSHKKQKLYVVQCRKCYPCLRRQEHEWVQRALREMPKHEKTWFNTYTFTDQALANLEKGTPHKVIAQHFNSLKKKLKRSSVESPIMYFYVEEYGKTKGRYHIHAIVSGPKQLTKKIQEDLWPHGHTKFRLVKKGEETSAAKYVTKYLFKGKKEIRDNRKHIRASIRYGKQEKPNADSTRDMGIHSQGRKKVPVQPEERTIKQSTEGRTSTLVYTDPIWPYSNRPKQEINEISRLNSVTDQRSRTNEGSPTKRIQKIHTEKPKPDPVGNTQQTLPPGSNQ